MAPTATVPPHPTEAPVPAKTGSQQQQQPSPLSLILSYKSLTEPSTIASLRRAMVGLGFFYLSDSPLEAERDRLFELTKRFFDTEGEEERRGIEQEKSRHFRGWSGLGLEHTQNRPDNREQVSQAGGLAWEVDERMRG